MKQVFQGRILCHTLKALQWEEAVSQPHLLSLTYQETKDTGLQIIALKKEQLVIYQEMAEGGSSLSTPKGATFRTGHYIGGGRECGVETGSLYMAKLKDPTSANLPLPPKCWEKGVCHHAWPCRSFS